MQRFLVAIAMLLTPVAVAQTPENELGGLVSQEDYESFMRCMGGHAGGLDALARIAPSAKEPEAVRNIELQGREILESLDATVEELNDRRVKLDHDAGTAAYLGGRKIFDDAKKAPANEQYAIYREHGGFGDDCRATMQLVIGLSAIQAASFAEIDKLKADAN